MFSFIIFFVLFPAAAQRNVVRVDGNVNEQKEKLEGVSVTVYKSEQFIMKTVTESNGKFRFQLDYDSDYLLEFSKPGFVSKKVSVNTEGVPSEDQDFGHEYGGWDLSLFRRSEGMDLAPFEKPFVKISYNPELNKFEHDIEYTRQVKEEFEQIQKDFTKKKKEEEKRKKEEVKAEEKAAAEAAAKQKADEAAKKKARLDAEKQNKAPIKTGERDSVKSEENSAKIAQAKTEEENKPDSSPKVVKSEEDYRQNIIQADKFFNNKDYESARKHYQLAQDIKPKENYPRQKIQEINITLNNFSISANKTRRDTGEYKTKEEFLQALAKLYPQGITEEIYMEGNVKITRRIVVEGNSGTEYKMSEHAWGGRFWFKNGTPINELIWNTETQVKK